MQHLRDADNKRELTHVVNRVVEQFDAYGRFALDDSTTSTTVFDARITDVSEVQISPRSEGAKGIEYWIEVEAGNFTVHHDSDTTDRTFAFFIHGI